SRHRRRFAKLFSSCIEQIGNGPAWAAEDRNEVPLRRLEHAQKLGLQGLLARECRDSLDLSGADELLVEHATFDRQDTRGPREIIDCLREPDDITFGKAKCERSLQNGFEP